MFEELRFKAKMLSGGEWTAIILLPLLIIGMVVAFVVASGNTVEKTRTENAAFCKKIDPFLGTPAATEVAAAELKNLSTGNTARQATEILADPASDADETQTATETLQRICGNYTPSGQQDKRS